MNKEDAVIVLTYVYPYPPTDGGKISAATTIQLLAQHYSVHLFCLYEKNEIPTVSYPPELAGVYIFPAALKNQLFWTHVFRMIRTWIRGEAYTIKKFWSAELQQKFAEIYQALNKPPIIVERLAMAQYVEERSYSLIEQNIETKLIHRRQQVASRMERRVWTIEEKLTQRFEVHALRHACRIMALSPVDRDTIVKEFEIPQKRVEFHYPPIMKPWHRSVSRNGARGAVTVIGAVHYRDNELALEWFLEEILPRLPASVPVIIAGEGTGQIVTRRRLRSRVRLIEQFEDVGDFIDDIEILAVPLQTAGGIRIKILQALTAGIPIVSTTVGVQGVAWDQAGIMVDFVSCIMSVYNNPKNMLERIAIGTEFVDTHLNVQGYDHSLQRLVQASEPTQLKERGLRSSPN
ncbi:MAG: glycosyltransferase [Firmicutes bacterium]|nr:glycosyltransferase [Bacillota bacterium]